MPVETTTGYKVVLSIAQRAFLVMLAERSRSQTMDPTNFTEVAIKGIADLESKALIKITPLIHRSSKHYELTELGVQVVDQIYASQKQSAAVTDHVQMVVDKAGE